MYHKKFNKLKTCFCIGAALLIHGVMGQPAGAEGGNHGAHVHGIAHINVALEKNEVYIEFKSPAANIIGFEHSPGNEMEKRAVREAAERLKAGEKIFKFDSGAGVTLKEAVVTTGDEDERHHGEHEKHETEHHGDGESEHGEQHSEFKAAYRFHCKQPDAVRYMDVMLFEHFKGIEEIEVQVLTETNQTSLELTPRKSRVPF